MLILKPHKFPGIAPEILQHIEDLMFSQDIDRLNEEYGCGCCCGEHTFSHCISRTWGGCRGGMSYGAQPIENEWAEYLWKRGLYRI